MAESSAKYIELLISTYASDRLQAARFFADHASPSDLNHLQAALAREKVVWIENALRRAIFRLEPQTFAPDPFSKLEEASSDAETLPDQMFAEALEATTKQVLHEIEPLVGGLRLAAEKEVKDYSTSRTREKLNRLSQFMAALSRLREAASSPEMQEFHLDGTCLDCISVVQEELLEGQTPVVLLKIADAGKRPCIAYGDPGMLSLAIKNGIKNAVEATLASQSEARSDVVVSWGETEKNFWVSIVDHGVGLQGNSAKAFEMGKTSKPEHLGMGLTISKRAIDSLGGEITLTPRDIGVRFEISWPKRA